MMIAFQLNKQKIENINVLGTKHLIEACRKFNIANLVYTSTYNVVFGGQIIRNGDETLPYLPLDKVRQSSPKLVAMIIKIM